MLRDIFPVNNENNIFPDRVITVNIFIKSFLKLPMNWLTDSPRKTGTAVSFFLYRHWGQNSRYGEKSKSYSNIQILKSSKLPKKLSAGCPIEYGLYNLLQRLRNMKQNHNWPAPKNSHKILVIEFRPNRSCKTYIEAGFQRKQKALSSFWIFWRATIPSGDRFSSANFRINLMFKHCLSYR